MKNLRKRTSVSAGAQGASRMAGGGKGLPPGRQSGWLADLRWPAALMFVGFVIMAMMTVLPEGRGLGVAAPRSRWLSAGGALSWLARHLGIEGMSSGSLAGLYVFALVLLFASYAWALVVAARSGRETGRAFLLGCAVAFGLLVVFVPPFMAKDLFNYAAYGRTVAAYGKNPYALAPFRFPGEPVLHFISWKGAVSVYGPFFNYLAALVETAAGRSAVSAVVGFKLVSLSFFAGSVILTDELALRVRPGRRAFIVTAAAWNPLVVLLLVGGGHNDTMMVFFVILGLLMYLTGRPVLGLASVMLAFLVKSSAALVMLPMLVLFLRERARWGNRKYWQAAAALAALGLAFYLPLWPGKGALFKILSVGSGYSSGSVPRFFAGQLAGALRLFGFHAGTADTVAHQGISGLFTAIFVVVLVALSLRVRDFRSLLRNVALISIAFVLSASWLMPWYAGFVVMLVALSGSYQLTGAAVAVTFVMLWFLPGRWQLPNSALSLALVVIAAALAVALYRRAGHRMGSPHGAPPGGRRERAEVERGETGVYSWTD
jgi:alpha-1,6-mannosyltransferase